MTIVNRPDGKLVSHTFVLWRKFECQICKLIFVEALECTNTEIVKATYFFILFIIDYDIKGTGSFVLLPNGHSNMALVPIVGEGNSFDGLEL